MTSVSVYPYLCELLVLLLDTPQLVWSLVDWCLHRWYLSLTGWLFSPQSSSRIAILQLLAAQSEFADLTSPPHLPAPSQQLTASVSTGGCWLDMTGIHK